MHTLVLFSLLLTSDGQVEFQRQVIDGGYPGGYQLAVADMNADGRLDVVALSTQADRVDWYENPSWRQIPVARTVKNIDLALHDLNSDGQPEIALASGFYFSESSRGGEIAWLSGSAQAGQPWQVHPIATDPVVHRLRWGDLDGDGRAELVHASLFGAGSNGPQAPTPAHLWAFRVPDALGQGPWEAWKIDETLTVLHGIFLGDLDGDRRDEILTASFEGICRFDFEGSPADGAWHKAAIAPGAEPAGPQPGAARGTSEVVAGKSSSMEPFLAAIEPWHGHQLVVYEATRAGHWKRAVLDDTLREGHALLAADFDGDGSDEIVAGWRGGRGGLAMYRRDRHGQLQKTMLDQTVAVEGAVAADLNGNGRLDLVVIGGRTNNVVWYDNTPNASRRRSSVVPAR